MADDIRRTGQAVAGLGGLGLLLYKLRMLSEWCWEKLMSSSSSSHSSESQSLIDLTSLGFALGIDDNG